MAKRNKKNKKIIKEDYYALSVETKKGLVIILLATITIISILSFLDLAGTIGLFIDRTISAGLGVSKIAFPLIILGVMYAILRPGELTARWVTLIGLTLLILSLNALVHMTIPLHLSQEMALEGSGGGLIGYALSYPLLNAFGFLATLIIVLATTAAAILLSLNSTSWNIFALFGRRNNHDEAHEDDDYDTEEDANEKTDASAEETTLTENPDPEFKRRGLFARKEIPKAIPAKKASEPEKLSESKYKSITIELPVNLLSQKASKPRSGDISLAMERIETTLSNFGIDVEMDEVSVGPTVTQYTLKPSEGVKVARITALSNDLALALAAHPIRIEAPIPGKSLIGIEVPNHQPATVGLREIIESKEFKTSGTSLGLALGKDVGGKCWVTSLAKMPHLLVAGATGSGKSVCLNTIILSLLYQNNPNMLRMILIDPKRVEFPIYNGIPHLLTPVVTDVTRAVNALRWAIQEMDRRFDILAKEGKRNIDGYNEVAENKMPYLVIVIDELADLMIAASNEVEASIIRLTQMARAVGIHLILATQRPSVDVITGLIKANVPARIAFSVASSMDSRTILDSVGAEKLIGKGDMLFQTAEISKPRRLQGAFVSDDEIKRVARFLKQAAGEPEYDDSVTEKQKGATSFDYGEQSETDNDELMEEAKELVIKSGKASASYLQRRFRIGYARAARLIDLLEESGVVGPADGARPREILMSLDEARESAEQTPTVFADDTFESEDSDEE